MQEVLILFGKGEKELWQKESELGDSRAHTVIGRVLHKAGIMKAKL